MLEDFRLKVFVTLAEQKSFTKTAEALRISQPAVSQHISELEKHLDVKLFDRLKGETALTPAGRVLEEYAQSILRKYAEMEQMFVRFPDRVVNVSASDDVFSYFDSVLLRKFHEVHPEISFRNVMIQEVDLRIVMEPSDKERGMIRLSYHPSSTFASTRLWRVLSELLEPTLE